MKNFKIFKKSVARFFLLALLVTYTAGFANAQEREPEEVRVQAVDTDIQTVVNDEGATDDTPVENAEAEVIALDEKNKEVKDESKNFPEQEKAAAQINKEVFKDKLSESLETEKNEEEKTSTAEKLDVEKEEVSNFSDAAGNDDSKEFTGRTLGSEEEAILETHQENTDTAEAGGQNMQNTNGSNVATEANVESKTGENVLEAGEDIEESGIVAGDVNLFANVLTVANTNLVNSEIVTLTENFNRLTTDLVMNHPEQGTGERMQKIIDELCLDEQGGECQSLSTFLLTNQNDATVENNVTAEGVSGRNKLRAGEDVERSRIRTGNVNAIVNVITLVNTHAVNSRFTIASFNIFGDWDGNLEFPSQEWFLEDTLTLGGAPLGLASAKQVLIEAANANDVVIDNNVEVVTNTGDNIVEATGGNSSSGKKKSGDIEDTSVTAGAAKGGANVMDIANTTLINAKWFLGIVNVLGSWNGQVYSLPDQVAMGETPFGMTFLASPNNSVETAENLSKALSGLEAESDSATVTENENVAAVNNNVRLVADTGSNKLRGREVEDSEIFTGSAKALANILTFANTNLVNAELYVGLVNVFGTWNGNIVFGHPDLSISQTGPSVIPSVVGSKADFTVAVANNSGSNIPDAKLDWQYDASVFKFGSVSSAYPFNQSPGVVQLMLGNLAPHFTGSAVLELELITPPSGNDEVVTIAKISGSSPEKNIVNNQVVTMTKIAAENTAESLKNQNSNSPSDQTAETLSAAQPANTPVQSAVGTYALQIHKNNSAASGGVKPGENVAFTITVDSNGSEALTSVVVYDILYGPNDMILGEKTYELGALKPGEQAVIEYEILIPTDSEFGTYTNTAQAKGFGNKMTVVYSDTVASSSFIIRPSATTVESIDNISSDKKIQKEDASIRASKNVKTGGNLLATTSANLPDGNGSGYVPVKMRSRANAEIIAWSGQQSPPEVQGSPPESGILPASVLGKSVAVASGIGMEVNRSNPLLTENPLTGTLFLCFLLAFGYALMRQKQTKYSD